METLKLSEAEVRVLGALIEKELATPEYYPLTTSALVAACNQKTGRDPVTSYTEDEVQRALDGLMRRRMAGTATGAGQRAVKYRHALAETFGLGRLELALVGVLLLRGPQTNGELRGRTERMARFADLSEVEAALAGLAEHTPPLAVRLERGAGQKEARWAHLFGDTLPAPAPGSDPADDDRLAALEAEVQGLRTQIASLEAAFEAFRREFQ